MKGSVDRQSQRELISNELEKYHTTHGIFPRKTELGTLQYNGVVERMNKTIVENGTLILRMSKLPNAL